MCPGLKRPFLRIFSGGNSTTPASLAIIARPSSVTTYLHGLKPFLSRVPPRIFPSVNTIAAGPSQGSIIDA